MKQQLVAEETRKLTYSDSVLKFPCGVKVEIEVGKLVSLCKLFKCESFGKQLTENGVSEVPKSVAFNLKSYLT